MPDPDEWGNRREIVLFMSDGHCSVSQKIIDEVKEISDVLTIAYGDDANHQTLSKISADGQVHRVGTRGGELRAFLADVGKTPSEKQQQNR